MISEALTTKAIEPEVPAAKQAAARGRPRRAPSDAEARKRLIRSGLVFLTERGYSPVALDEILRHAEVPKGGFYHYFDSKADFGLALVDAYHDYFAAKLDRWFQDETLAPLARIRAFVTDAEQGMARHNFRRGCLIGNLGQEMAALPDAYRARLIAVLEDWQSRMATCLETARAAGEIGEHHDTESLAAFFWSGWEGAVLRSKLECRPEPLRIFAAGFFQLLT